MVAWYATFFRSLYNRTIHLQLFKKRSAHTSTSPISPSETQVAINGIVMIANIVVITLIALAYAESFRYT